VSQVFELADLLGCHSFGNIRKAIGGYRLRYARNGQMHAHPEVFATRPAAEWALWAMGRDGLADTNHDRRYRALVLLATFASLRWGEVTALRRCDIDLSAGAVRVRAAFVERSTGELVLGAPKSRAGRRVVGIPAAIIPLLQEHLAVYVARPRARCCSRASRAGRCGGATSTRCPPGRTQPARSAPKGCTFTIFVIPGITSRR